MMKSKATFSEFMTTAEPNPHSEMNRKERTAYTEGLKLQFCQPQFLTTDKKFFTVMNSITHLETSHPLNPK